MTLQMGICIGLFVAMLISFLLNKLPLGVTAGTVAALLVITGCTEPKTILSSIGNANTVTICCMIILAAGLGKTSFPAKLTHGIRKITKGNYRLAYLGVLLIALALTSMLTSPMAAYATPKQKPDALSISMFAMCLFAFAVICRRPFRLVLPAVPIR